MKRAFIVVDLGYGDAGKGTTVDYLCRVHPVDLVVLFNGGPQRAHNVVTTDGIHHTFSQFGSGSLAGVNTHLSRFVFVDPWNLVPEAQALEEKAPRDIRLTISPHACIVTPYHVAMNRLREAVRGENRHGSCGLGHGEAVAETKWTSPLRFREVPTSKADMDGLVAHLTEMRKRYIGQAESQDFDITSEHWSLLDHDPEQVAGSYVNILNNLQINLVEDHDILAQADTVVFEGSQGVLIDQTYGFAPYYTWSNCTFDNAMELIDAQHLGGDPLDKSKDPVEVTRLGVLRTYTVRHGPGPFPSYSEALTELLVDPHNGFNEWQREFRVGNFDFVMAKYAIEACGGVDGIVLTHLDKVPVGHHEFHYAVGGYYRDDRPQDESYYHNMDNWIYTVDPVSVEQYRPLMRPMDPIASGPYGTDHGFVWGVEDRLEVPVVIGSWGPTAADKRYLK